MPCRARGASHVRGSGPRRGGGRRGASRCRARRARTRVLAVRACYTERVPRLFPFRGLQYDPSVAGPLDRLTAPPYDVISESDQQGLRARSPYNIVHIDLTGGAVGDGAVPGYATAASLLADWSASGVLTAPDAPRYYGYELRHRRRGDPRPP